MQMPRKVGQDTTAAIRDALLDVPHGWRGDVVDELAERFGIHPSTVRKHADLNGTPRMRSPSKPHYDEWVRVALALAHRSTPPLGLELAIECAVAGGELPEAALAMPVATAHRIAAKRLNIRTAVRRTQRLAADWPMQAIQFDASMSEHLVPVERVGDDWLLRVFPGERPGGKNKFPRHARGKPRLVCYGLWDMATGLTRARYTVSLGENALDAITSLIAMLSLDDDPERPLCGVPESLWVDQGPLFKSRASRDLLGRLGIALSTGAPYQKTRQGGVERAWRTLWGRFERALVATGAETVLLSEVATRLAEHERRQGRRAARTLVAGRIISRAKAFVALSGRRPEPLRRFPENALQTLYREDTRNINSSGLIQWDGEEWECSLWHSRRDIIVRQPLDGSRRLVLEDPATGERAEAVPLPRRAHGVVVGQPRPALDRLLEDIPPSGLSGGDIYGTASESEAGDGGGNVVHLAARLRAARDLEDPLATDKYASVEGAIQGFYSMAPVQLGPDDIAALKEDFLAWDLSRARVAEVAAMAVSLANSS